MSTKGLGGRKSIIFLRTECIGADWGMSKSEVSFERETAADDGWKYCGSDRALACFCSDGGQNWRGGTTNAVIPGVGGAN